jgi:hypothetical protein
MLTFSVCDTTATRDSSRKSLVPATRVLGNDEDFVATRERQIQVSDLCSEY